MGAPAPISFEQTPRGVVAACRHYRSCMERSIEWTDDDRNIDAIDDAREYLVDLIGDHFPGLSILEIRDICLEYVAR